MRDHPNPYSIIHNTGTPLEEKLGIFQTSRIFADVLQSGANQIGVLEVSAAKDGTTPANSSTIDGLPGFYMEADKFQI